MINITKNIGIDKSELRLSLIILVACSIFFYLMSVMANANPEDSETVNAIDWNSFSKTPEYVLLYNEGGNYNSFYVAYDVQMTEKGIEFKNILDGQTISWTNNFRISNQPYNESDLIGLSAADKNNVISLTVNTMRNAYNHLAYNYKTRQLNAVDKQIFKNKISDLAIQHNNYLIVNENSLAYNESDVNNGSIEAAS